MNERDNSASPAGSENAVPASVDAGSGRNLATALILYTVARLGLVIVLAAVIYGGARVVGVEVPILVAAIFAVVIALPLGMLLFKKLRTNVNAAITDVDADRRAKRDALQARLQGSSARPARGKAPRGGSRDPRS